jgi:hypothetical protein
MGAFAEFERSIIKEHVRAGLPLGLVESLAGGRPAGLFDSGRDLNAHTHDQNCAYSAHSRRFGLRKVYPTTAAPRPAARLLPRCRAAVLEASYRHGLVLDNVHQDHFSVAEHTTHRRLTRCARNQSDDKGSLAVLFEIGGPQIDCRRRGSASKSMPTGSAAPLRVPWSRKAALTNDSRHYGTAVTRAAGEGPSRHGLSFKFNSHCHDSYLLRTIGAPVTIYLNPPSWRCHICALTDIGGRIHGSSVI